MCDENVRTALAFNFMIMAGILIELNRREDDPELMRARQMLIVACDDLSNQFKPKLETQKNPFDDLKEES